MINPARGKNTRGERERENEKPKVRWSGNGAVIIYVKNYGLHHDPPTSLILHRIKDAPSSCKLEPFITLENTRESNTKATNHQSVRKTKIQHQTQSQERGSSRVIQWHPPEWITRVPDTASIHHPYRYDRNDERCKLCFPHHHRILCLVWYPQVRSTALGILA